MIPGLSSIAAKPSDQDSDKRRKIKRSKLNLKASKLLTLNGNLHLEIILNSFLGSILMPVNMVLTVPEVPVEKQLLQ